MIAIIAISVLTITGLGMTGYLIYRRGLRYAKGIERGIKMVPILINLPPASEDVEVGGRDVRDVMQERNSQAEVLYNLIASTATKGFKSKFFGQRHIGFEIVAIDGIIRFYAAVPVAMVSVIKQAILTAYPGAQLEEVEDHNIFSEAGKISGTYGGEVKLKKEYSYPIATFNELQRDAVSGLINSLKSLEEGDGATIQILLRPASEGWEKNTENLAKKLGEDDDSKGFSLKHVLQAPFKVPESSDDGSSKAPKQLSNTEQSTIEAIERKGKASGYEVLIRVIASSATASRAQANTNNIVAAFSLFDAPGLNGFKFEPAKNIENFVTDFIFRFFPPEKNKMVLNSIELSTLFHFPDDQFTKTSQIQRQQSKQIEGPNNISQTGVLVGHNVHHGVKKEIRLNDNDRRRHVYIVGQTGTGKSVLLENMMVQDMRDGKGFAFIDPHGDAAEELLGMLPKERAEDVIYFDPGDMDNPPGLNLFEYHTEDQKDFLIQEAINMLEKLYDPHNQGIVGPRYHHMFRNAALTVMADPAGGTFIDVSKLFRDPQFVKDKLKHVQDKTVLEFWQKEMPAAQRSSDHGEMVSWFVSKFGAFLSNQMMRNIIGQSQSSFDLRDVMDNRKILIANLSKGRLGELNSKLLGMIFVMKFQAAAMSRASVPEDQRVDFSLYVDEFQNFSTESFAHILSEARKYRLNLIVANQFISQLSEEVREAVFGNVGTIVSFRSGPNDADFLVKQFAPTFNERDLVNMPNYNTAIRLMNDGLPTKPFSLATLPPIGSANPKLIQAVKQLSSIKYGKPRQEVEDEIFDRLSTKPPPSPFDSLASSRREESSEGSQASGSRPRPDSSATSSQGGQSFLDEWLAKRRQHMQQPSQQGGRVSASDGATNNTQEGRFSMNPDQSQNQNQNQNQPSSQQPNNNQAYPPQSEPQNTDNKPDQNFRSTAHRKSVTPPPPKQPPVLPQDDSVGHTQQSSAGLQPGQSVPGAHFASSQQAPQAQTNAQPQSEGIHGQQAPLGQSQVHSQADGQASSSSSQQPLSDQAQPQAPPQPEPAESVTPPTQPQQASPQTPSHQEQPQGQATPQQTAGPDTNTPPSEDEFSLPPSTDDIPSATPPISQPSTGQPTSSPAPSSQPESKPLEGSQPGPTTSNQPAPSEHADSQRGSQQPLQPAAQSDTLETDKETQNYAAAINGNVNTQKDSEPAPPQNNSSAQGQDTDGGSEAATDKEGRGDTSSEDNRRESNDVAAGAQIGDQQESESTSDRPQSSPDQQADKAEGEDESSGNETAAKPSPNLESMKDELPKELGPELASSSNEEEATAGSDDEQQGPEKGNKSGSQDDAASLEAMKDELSKELGSEVTVNSPGEGTDSAADNKQQEPEPNTDTATSQPPQQDGSSDTSAKPQSETKDGSQKPESNIPHLKPGEVYIDEDGNVHKG